MTKYRVLLALNYATDRGALRRLRAGENLPFRERGMKRAEPGDVVEDIPRESMPWLLERGAIEIVEEEAPE